MVIVSEKAKSILRSLDSSTRKQLGGVIRKFQNGEAVDLKKLQGEEQTWRIACGCWRVLVEVTQRDGEKIFEVTDVVSRKDAYR